MTRLGLVLGLKALLLAWCSVAVSAVLDQDACARLKTEAMQLELAGTRTNMAKGPEWAKANLGADKLQQIKRLLELEEQILFRCQGKPLVVLPEGVDGEAAAAAAADRGKDGTAKPAAEAKGASRDPQPPPGKAQAKPAAPAGAKAAGAAAKAPPGKAAGAVKAPAEVPEAAVKPKPKPKPKPKVDDAYRPAPAQPAAPPGSGQP